MGVQWKKDSVKELREQKTRKQLQEQKTRKQLQEENEQLQARVQELESQLTDTQLALCDVYELLEGGEG